MKRRFLQFSLRGLLVAMTAAAIWLAVITNRARTQHEAAESLKKLGWGVRYDWEDDQPRGPAWLCRLVGDDYFQVVVEASFLPFPGSEMDASRTKRSILFLKRLPGLKHVVFLPFIPPARESFDAFRAALPGCRFSGVHY